MDIMKMGKNPNYLGGWDLTDEKNHEITVTIDRIVEEEVISAGQKEHCAVCYFAEDYKPMILNLINRKRIIKLYKTKDDSKLRGKRITITTERVKAFGDVFDALRVKTVLPPAVSDKKYFCAECEGEIEASGKMTAQVVAEYTKKKYGACLCSNCATARANALKEANNESDKA